MYRRGCARLGSLLRSVGVVRNTSRRDGIWPRKGVCHCRSGLRWIFPYSSHQVSISVRFIVKCRAVRGVYNEPHATRHLAMRRIWRSCHRGKTLCGGTNSGVLSRGACLRQPAALRSCISARPSSVVSVLLLAPAAAHATYQLFIFLIARVIHVASPFLCSVHASALTNTAYETHAITLTKPAYTIHPTSYRQPAHNEPRLARQVIHLFDPRIESRHCWKLPHRLLLWETSRFMLATLRPPKLAAPQDNPTHSVAWHRMTVVGAREE